MQIAVIGWGSLIWCPGCLQIESRWHSDGPALPIEFARISGDKRLTLVIHRGSRRNPTPNQQTYWASSTFRHVGAARQNLQSREGAKNLEDIHSVTARGHTEGAVDPVISARIRRWLKGAPGVQAAVWTGLSTNWPRKRTRNFTPEDTLQYVNELEHAKDEAKEAYDRAREYIINAPSQIQTPVRRLIRETRGWRDAALPAILFHARPDADER